MTDKRIIEEMARLDGYEYTANLAQNHSCWNKGFTHCCTLPDYLNDHNAALRVMAGLTDAEKREAVHQLDRIIHTLDVMPFYLLQVAELILAPPRQICEAILKAKGVRK